MLLGCFFFQVRPDVCLEAHVPYEIRLQMGEKRTGVQDRSASILIDSIVLVPPTDVLPIFKGSPVAEQHRYVETFFERHVTIAPIFSL